MSESIHTVQVTYLSARGKRRFEHSDGPHCQRTQLLSPGWSAPHTNSIFWNCRHFYKPNHVINLWRWVMT